MGEFSDKVLLVSGASSGIGRAAAVLLAQQGATVIAAARARPPGELLVDELRAAGANAVFVSTDVSREDSVDALFAFIDKEFGRLDGAFNNAAAEAQAASVADASLEAFDHTFATNVRGTWMCMRHEMRMMRKQGHGAIVNTGSIAGLFGYAHSSIYVASKHAVIGMTKSAGIELADKGVRVNCVCPGVTRTPASERWLSASPEGESGTLRYIPMRRIAAPSEVAHAAVWLLSDAASYITGTVLVADGGMTVP